MSRVEAREKVAWGVIVMPRHLSLSNGLMAEQIHPFTDEPPSACPLTWSHSTFVLAVHEYMTKCREFRCSADYLDDKNVDHSLDQEAPITTSEGAVL
jgi:hypothetical protein